MGKKLKSRPTVASLLKDKDTKICPYYIAEQCNIKLKVWKPKKISTMRTAYVWITHKDSFYECKINPEEFRSCILLYDYKNKRLRH